VPDIAHLEMPVKLRLKLGAVIGLDDVDAERQSARYVIDELDGRALVTRIVDLQDPNPGAIIDRGELIESASRSWDPL
jgi:hypothetical protein